MKKNKILVLIRKIKGTQAVIIRICEYLLKSDCVEEITINPRTHKRSHPGQSLRLKVVLRCFSAGMMLKAKGIGLELKEKFGGKIEISVVEKK